MEPKYLERILWKIPDKYFTKEVLDKLDVVAEKEFLYGTSQSEEVIENEGE